MTNTCKWLAGGLTAALLLGTAGLFGGTAAEAQQPDGPPHQFDGTVSIDGETATAGVSVVAVVNDHECGAATVADGGTYVLHVLASCATDGDTVHFRVGGHHAAETGTYAGATRTALNLTASMADMPDEPGDDMGDGDEPDEPDMGDGDECPESDVVMGDDPAEPGMGDQPAEPDVGDDMDGMDDCPDDGDMGDGDEPDEPSEPGDDMGDGDEPDEPSEPGDDMGDGDMGDGHDDDMDDPMVGHAGSGLAPTSGAGAPLAAVLGALALALALGATAFARRR